MASNVFVVSRIELQGWGCWRNIRGTGITLEEAKALVSRAKARIKQDDLHVFDWHLTNRDQGNFDTKMMGVLFAPTVRKRVQLDLQQNLIDQPLPFKGATLELDPVKSPWNKAQALFIRVMREYAQLLEKPLTSDGWIRDCASGYQHREEAL